jgi:hypothetical protein
LQKPLTIRNILAGFFLLLFAFCITPKRTLHNLVANHTDGGIGAKSKGPYQSQIGRLGFNCQVDNLICESPFIDDTQTSFTVLLSSFVPYREKQTVSFYSSAFFCSGLRGPPAC